MNKIKNIKLFDSERQRCEIWTRVMGYFRPLSQFNKGKKSEFYERRYYKENKISELEKKVKDYEKVLVLYAKRDMYLSEFSGYDYESVIYKKSLNPINPALDVLKKYGVKPEQNY